MMQTAQVQMALRELTLSAEAIRHASLALNGRPEMALPTAFAYNAIAPIARLALLLGVEEPQEPSPARPPRRKARARGPRPTRKAYAKPHQTKELEEFVERVSAWDPEALPDDLADPAAEAASCRALLLEVIRRACFDWVLYRGSSKLQNKSLAESAFHWLFVENEQSASWSQRVRNGKQAMSLIAICDALDITPYKVRQRARKMTEKDIMGAGRPPERRKVRGTSDDAPSGDEHSVFDVDMDSLPTYDPMFVSEGYGHNGYGHNG